MILLVPMLVLAQFLPALWPQGILLLIYDVAGIEGVEWWIMWIVFALLGSMLTVPGTIIVQAFRSASIRRHSVG